MFLVNPEVSREGGRTRGVALLCFSRGFWTVMPGLTIICGCGRHMHHGDGVAIDKETLNMVCIYCWNAKNELPLLSDNLGGRA